MYFQHSPDHNYDALKIKEYLPVNIKKEEADLHSGQVQRKVACNLVSLKKMLTYNLGDLDDSWPTILFTSKKVDLQFGYWWRFDIAKNKLTNKFLILYQFSSDS